MVSERVSKSGRVPIRADNERTSVLLSGYRTHPPRWYSVVEQMGPGFHLTSSSPCGQSAAGMTAKRRSAFGGREQPSFADTVFSLARWQPDVALPSRVETGARRRGIRDLYVERTSRYWWRVELRSYRHAPVCLKSFRGVCRPVRLSHMQCARREYDKPTLSSLCSAHGAMWQMHGRVYVQIEMHDARSVARPSPS